MLTDQTRGPFKIVVQHVEAKNPPLDNSYWCWSLLDAQGRTISSGIGYTTHDEAHEAARRVRDSRAA